MSDARSTPEVDTQTPMFTVRAVMTGAVLGAVLSICNVYSGLKTGWSFNMSIVACLLSFGFWAAARALFGAKPWTMQENNINQTGASAAASISSAGLVSAVPALTLLEGTTLTWPSLALWTFLCAVLGVFVALAFRRQMLITDALPFASGVATAQTLKEMYAHGAEALARVKALLAGAAFAAAWKLTAHFAELKAKGLGWLTIPASSGGALAKAGAGKVSAHNLTFAFDPSLLMVGAGAIIGLRGTVSMLAGAFVGWGVLGMTALEQGWVKPGPPDAPWNGALGEWLIWPGVSFLVVASLTSLAFSAPAFVRMFKGTGPKTPEGPHDFPMRWIGIGVALVAVGVMATGYFLFGMKPWIGLLAVLLTSLLAVVALRVSGETNITPVGPMGKVTQLTFAVVDPGNVATNLMAANVTGGSASQAGDMMHDLKTGHVLGTSPRFQGLSQLIGVVAGALAGSAVYLQLIPDPKGQLLTEEWAAPAVKQWKAVAEVFRDGFDRLPPMATWMMLGGALAGLAMAVAEKVASPKVKKWLPSSSAFGIAVLVPAWFSISFFFGGVIAALAARWAKTWTERFLVVVASGVIAGESLTGAGLAVASLLG